MSDRWLPLRNQKTSATELYLKGMDQLASGALGKASWTLWKAADAAVKTYAASTSRDNAVMYDAEAFVLKRAEELGNVELIYLWCAADKLGENWLESEHRFSAPWVRGCAAALHALIEAFDQGD